jgi:hypothetical protein
MGAYEAWRARERERLAADLGPEVIAELESLALEKAAGVETIAAAFLPLMADVYKIGLGRRDPVAAERLEGITRAWHRDTCGCASADCAKRAGIAKFVEG